MKSHREVEVRVKLYPYTSLEIEWGGWTKPSLDQVPTVQDTKWASRSVWTGEENLDLHRSSKPELSSRPQF